MRKLAPLLIAVVCLSLAGLFVAHAGEYQSAPYTGSTEFERMKQLVGTWEGPSDMGKQGEKVRVEYRLTAGARWWRRSFPGAPRSEKSMHDLLPDGEDIRRAVKWVSGNLQENPGQPVGPFVQEAIFKFDLSPRDAEFLIMFFRQRDEEP
jgi:hypothetical protein